MNRMKMVVLAGLLAASSVMGQDGSDARSPVIKHQPVIVAQQGQSLAIRASISDESSIKSSTLYYSTSRDVAPFKLQMQNAGGGSYIGTIPANLIGKSAQLSYYIDAIDEFNNSSETPWYAVKVSSPSASVVVAPGGGEAAKGSSWTKPLLIGGGTLLVLGGAAAIAANSGGSSDTSTPPPGDGGVTNAGTYVGSVNTTLEISGQTPEYSGNGMTVVIDSDGKVSSSTILEGQSLNATLSGSDFTLIGPINDNVYIGEVRYVGTVSAGRISGYVTGGVSTSTGTNGVYSGSFYGVRQ